MVNFCYLGVAIYDENALRAADFGGPYEIHFKIFGDSGAEDRLIAALNGMTLDELHDAREAASCDRELPRLEGSLKQATWGALLRADLIRDAEAEGDDELVTQLRQIPDATWFIANRHRRPAELWGRLG